MYLGTNFDHKLAFFGTNSLVTIWKIILIPPEKVEYKIPEWSYKINIKLLPQFWVESLTWGSSSLVLKWYFF